MESHSMSPLYYKTFDYILHDPSRTETVPGNPSYKSVMRLHIGEVQHSDYGIYKCIAKNPRGETDGSIRLYCKYERICMLI